MFGLTTIPYKPDTDGLRILLMLSKGYTQREIARLFKITYANLRQRIARLKLNIGASTNEQMLFEYGKYLQKQEDK